MKLKILKGTRDYYPKEQRIREHILDVLKKYFKIYGYQPLETPILNYFDVLAAKYAGGAEILKETYQLRDQGGRHIALRYDLTVPFARFIGMNTQMSFPFKRYEIGKVFRNGPVKAGRAREFTQCDVDICGTKSLMSDAELICMAYNVFKELNIDITIQFNNRKLLSGIIKHSKISDDIVSSVILSLDKLEKIGWDGVQAELIDKGVKEESILSLKEILNEYKKKDNIFAYFKKFSEQNNDIKEGISELEEFYGYLKEYGIDENYLFFNPSLARGLEIYTGTVFEIFAKDSKITSSLAAGGRYDFIIGSFLQAEPKDSYPAVGICFGLDVIYAVLEDIKDKEEFQKAPFDIFIIPMNTQKESFKVMQQLRDNGISCDIEFMKRKLKKSLNYANKQNIPFVLIIGEDEIKSGKYTFKDMANSKEEKLSLNEIIMKFKGGGI